MSRPLPPRRIGMLAVLATVVLAFDIATKVLMVSILDDGERIQLIDGVASFVLVRNPGAAFSLATGMTWVLTLVALLVVAGIVRYARDLRSPGWAVALGLVLGGALGNLVDRFFRAPGPMEGHVVDFVSIGWWPVFNVADSAICIGAAVLVVLALRGHDIDGSRPEDRDPEDRDPEDRDPEDRGPEDRGPEDRGPEGRGTGDRVGDDADRGGGHLTQDERRGDPAPPTHGRTPGYDRRWDRA